jgi:dienelactone hydrolase
VYGGRDRLCTNEAQLKLWQAFMANGQPVEWHWYSWGDHGFTAPVSVGYQPDLARRARPLGFDFFDRHLKDAD